MSITDNIIADNIIGDGGVDNTTPLTQTVYGTLIKIDGTPDVGEIVTISLKSPQYLNGYLISKSMITVITDDKGYFQISVLKGLVVQFSITNYLTQTITITQDDSVNFLLYITIP